MNISKKLVGTIVEVIWRDPILAERLKLDSAPKGFAALAIWKEYGVIGDVTEGIVRVDHSLGENPPSALDRDREIMPTYIHEALIEKLTILLPQVGEST